MRPGPAPDARARRGALAGLGLGLGLANLAAWGWALLAFGGHPALLGTALLAYGFGLRHAVDADHIVAIDNVTRALMRGGRQPLAVGLWFALGHSTIVVAATVAVATAASFASRVEPLWALSGVLGTAISALVLLGVAAMNVAVLLDMRARLRRLDAGQRGEGPDPLAGGGLARLVRPLFRLIRAPWHMYPLGVLFGLGFDTATEVGLLGVSAAEARHGLPVWSILVFPALFAAGMSLVDTLDGVLMARAYGWASLSPRGTLRYNIAITLVSVLVALGVGGAEAVGLAGEQLDLHGALWRGADALNERSGLVGGLVVAGFAASWAGAAALQRLRRRAGAETGGL